MLSNWILQQYVKMLAQHTVSITVALSIEFFFKFSQLNSFLSFHLNSS